MLPRPSLVVAAAGAVLLLAPCTPASSQESGLRLGWSFQAAAYAWLPMLDGNFSYRLPTGAAGSASVSVGADDYFSDLNFAALVAGEIRYERFSMLTDIMYMDLNGQSGNFRSIDVVGVPADPMSTSLSSRTETNFKALIWTLAGGYTAATGSWGNLEVIGGFRYFRAEARTDYTLAADIAGPGGRGIALSRAGRLSAEQDIWNAIIGIRGRLRFGDSGFFIPYYVDIGTGDSNLTWQVFSGIGYQSGPVGVQLGYRYMSFDQGSGGAVQDVSLSGAYLAVNFSF